MTLGLLENPEVLCSGHIDFNKAKSAIIFFQLVYPELLSWLYCVQEQARLFGLNVGSSSGAILVSIAHIKPLKFSPASIHNSYILL